jgi:hypothetical protein
MHHAVRLLFMNRNASKMTISMSLQTSGDCAGLEQQQLLLNGSPVGLLARVSYALYRELAQTLGGNTGYREVRTFTVAASAKPGDAKSACAEHVLTTAYLFQSKLLTRSISWDSTTMQNLN